MRAIIRFSKILIVATLALQGCSTFKGNNTDDLRREGLTSAVMVALPFDSAVRNIFNASAKCWSLPDMPIGHFTSKRSLDEGNGKATATIGYEGHLFGFTVAEAIDLARQGEQTELRVFIHNGIFSSQSKADETAARLKQIALGNRAC